MPTGWAAAADGYIAATQAKIENLATRVASQRALNAYGPLLPELLGGSADLTPSNNTTWSGSKPIRRDDFADNYLNWGVREFGMAAAMNGIALHGGLIASGATFMVFTDYCRPAIRLSALMRQRAIYVMTHDSIGLGEDGPGAAVEGEHLALQAAAEVGSVDALAGIGEDDLADQLGA